MRSLSFAYPECMVCLKSFKTKKHDMLLDMAGLPLARPRFAPGLATGFAAGIGPLK